VLAGGRRGAGGALTFTRAEAEELDRDDPLAAFRDRFAHDEGVIYLDGNSLGRLPLATVDRLRAATVDEWGTALVRAWDRWVDLAIDVGDRLGAAALGAAGGQVLVADSTTINLYKLVAAALDARLGRITVVSDQANFPTDRYVLEGLCAQRGLELRLVPTAGDVAAAVDETTAVVCLSHVDYRSAERLDLAVLTATLRAAGALVVWDLSHSAGAVSVELDAAGVDLAVGCTYKYLNGGPGAPAYLYVRRALQAELRQPIWGWFGQRSQFAMGPHYDPEPDLRRFQTGTPNILGLYAVDAAVEVLAAAGIEAVAAKRTALTAFAVRLFDDGLAALGFELATPRDPERRGAHVALRHADGWRICQALLARDVVADFRPPDIVRLGFPGLYTRFVDVCDGFEAIRSLVASGEHLAYDEQPGRIT
jgi:kynureninase